MAGDYTWQHGDCGVSTQSWPRGDALLCARCQSENRNLGRTGRSRLHHGRCQCQTSKV